MSFTESHMSMLNREQQEVEVDIAMHPSPAKRSRTGSPTSVSTPVAAAGCPYAQAMQINNNETQMPSTSSTFVASSLPGMAELKECPAFANNACPFKDAKSPQEITEKLTKIPPSHLEGNTHSVFVKTLAFFHQSAASNPTNANNGSKSEFPMAAAASVVGTCPVKALVPKDWSFDRAMEDYSLAAVMSRLAHEHEENEQQAALFRQISEVDESLLEADAGVEKQDENHSTTTTTSSGAESLGSLTPPAAPTQGQPGTQAAAESSMGSSGTGRLSDALKSGTAEAHEAAESVHFVKNFIRGKIDRELYALLVAQLYHVYKKMETLLDEHAPHYFAECHFPRELNRTSALQEDVDFWHSLSSSSNGIASGPPVSPATRDYLERLDWLAQKNPLLLLAHAYTRYLGDLSGGQILARVARRALQLDKDGEGLAFYRFPRIESSKKFKDKYRNALNGLSLHDHQVQAMVQEANVAFLLNMRLFEELDVIGGVPGASVRDLQEVYATTVNINGRKQNKESQQAPPCPFAKTNVTATSSTSTASSSGKTCPWPFILLHDPKTGVQQWQTWLVIGLILALLYQKLILNQN